MNDLRIISRTRRGPFQALICVLLSVCLAVTPLTVSAADFDLTALPAPGTPVPVSEAYVPSLMRGLTVHPEEPFRFDFIFDSGNSAPTAAQLEADATRMIKYFMAALTVPREDLWVNLSPGQEDRIIPTELSRTQLGRDLLAQDYLLKQLSSTLLHPDIESGHDFWERVYRKVSETYGTTDIPLDTFNKVWIIPETAAVYEQGRTVYVRGAHLKVMLESDYLAAKDPEAAAAPGEEGISQTIAREVIVPEIEREVNSGRNFAPLRQIYYALILAKWYKQTMRGSVLSGLYVDQAKVDGVDDVTADVAPRIYDQYMTAYQRGVFDIIKEDYDRLSGKTIPRRYFSGGFQDAPIAWTRSDQAAFGITPTGENFLVTVDLNPRRPVRDQSILGQDGRFMTAGFRGWSRRIVLPVSLVLAGLVVIGTCETCFNDAAAQEPEAEVVQQMFEQNRLQDIILTLRRQSVTGQEAYLDEIEALGQPVMDRIIRELWHPDSFLYQPQYSPRLSVEAHRILARFGEPAVEEVIALLDERDPVVHGNAADALRELGARRAVPALIPKLVNAEGRLNSRVSEAIIVLDGEQALQALPVYITALQAEDKDVIAHSSVFGRPRNHAVAVRALRVIGDETALPVLQQYLLGLPESGVDDPATSPVAQAVDAMAEIYLRMQGDAPDVLPAISALRFDAQPRLRRLAYEIQDRLPANLASQLDDGLTEPERLEKIRADLQDGDINTRVYAIMKIDLLPTLGGELSGELLELARTKDLVTTYRFVYWPFQTRYPVTRDRNAPVRMQALQALLSLNAPAEELVPIFTEIIADFDINARTEQFGGSLFGVAVNGVAQLGPAAIEAGPGLLAVIDVPVEELIFNRRTYYAGVVNALVSIGYTEGVIPVVERHFLGQNYQTLEYEASLKALAQDPATLLRLQDRAYAEQNFIWWQRKAFDIGRVLQTHPEQRQISTLLQSMLTRDFANDDFLERHARNLELLAAIDADAFQQWEDRIFREKRWPVIRNWSLLGAGGGLLALLGLYGYLRRTSKEEERTDSAQLSDVGGIDMIDIPVERSGEGFSGDAVKEFAGNRAWVSGFSPVIRQITPLSAAPATAGR